MSRKEKMCKWRYGDYICVAKASSKKEFCEAHNNASIRELKRLDLPSIIFSPKNLMHKESVI